MNRYFIHSLFAVVGDFDFELTNDNKKGMEGVHSLKGSTLVEVKLLSL
jgi:hypothetical protein